MRIEPERRPQTRCRCASSDHKRQERDAGQSDRPHADSNDNPCTTMRKCRTHSAECPVSIKAAVRWRRQIVVAFVRLGERHRPDRCRHCGSSASRRVTRSARISLRNSAEGALTRPPEMAQWRNGRRLRGRECWNRSRAVASGWITCLVLVHPQVVWASATPHASQR
jgi:hypothetical protein